MKKLSGKRLALAALLLALMIGVSGCLVRPDTTEEELPTDPVQVLPFATLTPAPTAAPTTAGGQGEQGEQSGWQGGATIAPQPTSAPTPRPTIQVITAPPTQRPVWTIAPIQATPKPTDDGTLRSGSSGQAVRNLQQKLKDLGYYTGSVDGSFGSGTDTALRAFQTQNGLTSDGVAGSRTLERLYSPSAVAKPTAYAYPTSRPTPKTYTPSTPSTYRYLQLGSTGTDVTRLQNRLIELQYYSGRANGTFNESTESAVYAFQERNGLWADGVAGEDTQRMLYSNSALPYRASAAPTAAAYRTLREGVSGEDVRSLQYRLQELYYYSGSADGVFGESTALAVRVFQQRNGISVDGVAGSGTQSKLYSASAIAAPTTQPAANPTVSGTLQIGSTGDAVYRLQERLYDLNLYTGRIDGIYSEAVAQAVRAFQAANNLTVDGKAGTNTQMRLYSTSAVGGTGGNDVYTTLKEGDRGERVRALQSALASYQYFTSAVDGVYGDATITAVQQFQANNGLTVDGVAGSGTLQLLYQGSPKAATAWSNEQPSSNFVTLRQGMSGQDVAMMQEYLADLGYYAGTQDGSFGASTFVALQNFQARNGLTADGIAGQATLALLYSGDGVPAEGYGQQQTTARDTLKSGDEGQDVFDLQMRLQTLGYYTGTADGRYGTGTENAVRAFQGANGLKVDGKAGAATLSALYSATVVAAGGGGSSTAPLAVTSNRARELEEQRASGAIQGSLAGGGVAASHDSSIYFAGGANGTLYVQRNGAETPIYDGQARFIHASDRGITFASGARVMRVDANGGNPRTLIEAGGIEKLALVGDTMYYQEGNALVKATSSADAAVLAVGIRDFAIDIYQYTAYLATEQGVQSIGLNGNGLTTLVSTAADQVQLCDSIVFFRSGGRLYRIQDGISVLLADAEATWMGIYRDKLYYISGDRLYRSDTNGQNSQVFYDGLTAQVSFVAGDVYIARTLNGPVTEILPAD
ncbi:MAG: peptidoglycan-binding protein [Oscillospiraceae bacterium]|jgi:peptidoglycan hydrolase-like protein with peptidoglycan-binding domain|nr:peptidoglycan-binding protein [Oscillospiraceae bacterium]